MAKSKASLGRPLPDAKLPRNPFDRSHSISTNSKLGFIEPVFSEFVPAGSHVEINRSEVFRTADVNTAAMVGFDHFIDFFAVPVRLLWSEFDNWLLNIHDQHSSSFVDLSAPADNCPMRAQLPGWSLYNILLTSDNYDGTVAPGTGETTYPDFKFPDTSPIGYDGILGFNRRRLLNRLKYGIVPMQQDPADLGFIHLTKDGFGYVYDHSNEFQNLLRLCAYQKCYYDHYRNTAYENQSPFFFNLDWLKPGVTPSTTQLGKLMTYLTNLHSVNYRKDFFQAIYPALNYIPVDDTSWSVPANVVQAYGVLPYTITGTTGSDASRWRDSNEDEPVSFNPIGIDAGGTIYNDAQSKSFHHSHLLSLNTSQSIAPNAYNVQAIRGAFALDKLKRQSAYAPRHIKDQYEARYGFKYKGDDMHCVRIGSFKNEINLSEVTQTTPTSGSPLGTIGGKGYSACDFGETIKYDCGEGETIIMGLSYFMPRLCYDSLALDPFNCKIDREDFIIPEFMDLGLQPVYRKYFQVADAEGNSADTVNNTVQAYQVRYQEYKTGVNRNFGLFNIGNQLSVFSSHFDIWARTSLMSGLNWRWFKVRPQDVDNIFVDKATPEESTDQFYGFINFMFKCNQNLSVHGQPKL